MYWVLAIKARTCPYPRRNSVSGTRQVTNDSFTLEGGDAPLKLPPDNDAIAGNRLIPYLNVFNEIAYHGSKYFPGTPITNEYYARVNEAQSLVLQGRMAPRQVLETFKQSLQGQLDAALAK